MQTLPAWKHLDEWMTGQEQIALNKLKDSKVTDIAEIQGYRAKIQTFSQLRGEISTVIERGKQELKKQMAEQVK